MDFMKTVTFENVMPRGEKQYIIKILSLSRKVLGQFNVDGKYAWRDSVEASIEGRGRVSFNSSGEFEKEYLPDSNCTYFSVYGGLLCNYERVLSVYVDYSASKLECTIHCNNEVILQECAIKFSEAIKGIDNKEGDVIYYAASDAEKSYQNKQESAKEKKRKKWDLIILTITAAVMIIAALIQAFLGHGNP